MAKRHSDRPKEVSLDELLEQGDPSRQRSANPSNDPALRDGNSSHGEADWDAEDEITTDNDIGDKADTGEPLAGPSGGAIGGTPARGRTVDHVRHGLRPAGGRRGESTIGSDPKRKE
jgi:hypothetical protein